MRKRYVIHTEMYHSQLARYWNKFVYHDCIKLVKRHMLWLNQGWQTRNVEKLWIAFFNLALDHARKEVVDLSRWICYT